MGLVEMVDRSVDYVVSHVRLRFVLWVLGIPTGFAVFMILFTKSDLFSGIVASTWVLLFGLFLFLLYFLPAGKAYQDRKTNRQAILLLNIFLGWTIVGWVVALVWAFSKDAAVPVVAAIPSTLCASCGKYSQAGVSFCSHCGKRLQEHIAVTQGAK